MGIFSFITPKKNKIQEKCEKEVEGAEVWMVSWDARYGEYSRDKKRVGKAFLNEKDAKEFALSLHNAKDILQYTEVLNISVEKQL